MTLPVALAGTDVIGQAKTGTGKTLGFGLPLLERVTVPADVEPGRAKPEQLTDAPQALVVVPTRELCQQVTNDLLTAGKVRNVRVLSIYGGRAYEPQVEALKKGVDVIVGTPGRLLDLAGQKKLRLSDDPDARPGRGRRDARPGLPARRREDHRDAAGTRRQTMLFSATMPGQVISLARRYMSQPTHIRATAPDDEGQTVANTKQHVFRAHYMDKPEMVSRILQADGRGLVMVFCRTKRTAADVAEQLARRGFASGAVHGDLGQGAREQALRAFRNGKVDVLVCTDVAARGIDVDNVTHVINYQTPEDEKTYLHRIGRTGRAGDSGIAVTLVDWDDIPRWQLINKALGLRSRRPGGDLLHLAAPLRGAGHPRRAPRACCPAPSAPAPGWRPRRSRTWARPAPSRAESPLRPPSVSAPRAPVVSVSARVALCAPRAKAEKAVRAHRRRRRRASASASLPRPRDAVATAEGHEGEATGARKPRRRRRTRSGAAASAGAGTPRPRARRRTAARPPKPPRPRPSRRPRVRRASRVGAAGPVRAARAVRAPRARPRPRRRPTAEAARPADGR